MTKILITGATGFIGNFLVNEALRRGYDVYVAVRATSKTEHFSKKRVRIIEIDFSNAVSLHHLIYSLPRFDFIIHNAGILKSLDKDKYFEINYRNTKRFVTALIQQNKEPEKFIYISSIAAFGPGDKNSINPLLLTSIPNPVTSYGKSKLAAEKYIIEESQIPYIIIRPTAVYGPGEKDLFESIKLINKGIDFQVGTGNQRLTFVYVKDLARIVFDAIGSPLINRAYFITDGNLYNSKDLGRYAACRLKKRIMHIAVPIKLAKAIATMNELISKFSKKAPILNVEKVNELSACNWNCDIGTLNSDFNFKAEYNLRRGLNETIDWYKKEGWLK